VENSMYQELIVRLDGLKTDVSELKTDVSELKTDVSELKTDVSELKTDVSELKTSVIRIEKKLDNVTEQTAGLLEFRTETLGRLNELQDNQISVSAILGQHEMQIRSLQRR
jgi:chromosome segregation ATPase